MRSTLYLLAAFLGLQAGPAAAQQAKPTLALVNRSGQTIEELYVSSTRMSGWGDDRLGNDTIERNATFRLRLSDGCLYDLQVVYGDKRTEERMKVNLCRTPSQVFTAAEAHAVPTVPTHEFTLDNRSPRTIREVALADTSDAPGEEEWGDNLLSRPVPPGTQSKLSFEGECQMSVRVLFDNDAGEQRRSVDLCSGAKVLAVAPGWTTQDEPGSGDPAPEPAGLVTVSNHGTARMTELFLFPDGGPRGDDRLGARVLNAGSDVQVALQRDGKCLFTARAVFEGSVPDEVRTGLDFCPRRTLELGAPTP